MDARVHSDPARHVTFRLKVHLALVQLGRISAAHLSRVESGIARITSEHLDRISTVLNVGAAFWGLMAGLCVSWLLERPDFEPSAPGPSA